MTGSRGQEIGVLNRENSENNAITHPSCKFLATPLVTDSQLTY